MWTLNTPAGFGTAGSVLFRKLFCPRGRRPPPRASRWLRVAGNSMTDFDPAPESRYVQSWDIGLQRELTRDTVLEVRYVGNHGTSSLAPGQHQRDQRAEQRFPGRASHRAGNLAQRPRVLLSDPVCMSANRGKSNNYFGLAGQNRRCP
jgi:hypothetical protein